VTLFGVEIGLENEPRLESQCLLVLLLMLLVAHNGSVLHLRVVCGKVAVCTCGVQDVIQLWVLPRFCVSINIHAMMGAQSLAGSLVLAACTCRAIRVAGLLNGL
jgi:hypothetical protein